MKKLLFSILSMLLTASAINAQVLEGFKEAFSFTVDDKVQIGTQYTIGLNTTTAKSISLKIDCGDGKTFETFTDQSFDGNLQNKHNLKIPLTAKTIKVYAENPEDIARVDLTQCKSLSIYLLKNLKHLTFTDGSIRTIDTYANKELEILHCQNNELRTIKLHGLTLRELNCSNNFLISADINNCPSLEIIHCENNKIGGLSNSSTELREVTCFNNNIYSLKFDSEKLEKLLCQKNNILLSKLSYKTTQLKESDFSSQKNIQISRSYNPNQKIDINFVGGATKEWFTQKGEKLNEGSDYMVSSEYKRPISFLREIEDSIYCRFSDPQHPGLELKSNYTKIENNNLKIAATLTFSDEQINKKGWGYPIAISDVIDGAHSIYFQWEDGSTTEHISNTEFEPGITYVDNFTIALKSKKVKMLVADPTVISRLVLYGPESADVSPMTALTDIWFRDGDLKNIDLSKNLELDKIQFEKNELTQIDLSKNLKLKELNISNNPIRSINTKHNPLLENITIINTELADLDITKNRELKSVTCRSNKISVLEYTTETNPFVTSLACDNNLLTFATLLVPTTMQSQQYHPQADIHINTQYNTGSDIDLSHTGAQNYQWSTTKNVKLTEGKDYTVNQGITKFLAAQSDSVYCTMTDNVFYKLKLTTTTAYIQAGQSIDEQQSSIKVEGQAGTILITTDNPETYTIFNTSGIAIANGTAQGATPVPAPQGVYIVTVGDKKQKVYTK